VLKNHNINASPAALRPAHGKVAVPRLSHPDGGTYLCPAKEQIMPEPILQIPAANANTEARLALSQMYGYYAFDWRPFSPPRQPLVKDRT
jgi:hypothetical protein